MEKYVIENKNPITSNNGFIDSKVIYTRKSNLRNITIHSTEMNANLIKFLYHKRNDKRNLTNLSPVHYHKICPIHIKSYIEKHLSLPNEVLLNEPFLMHTRNDSCIQEKSIFIRFFQIEKKYFG